MSFAQSLLGVGSHADQEYAKVTHANVFNPADEWKTDDGQNGVEDDDWTSDVVFVADPSGNVHHDTSGGIWWSDQTLRLCQTEFHPIAQNDGQKVCEGVSNGRGHAKDPCKAPDLQVETSSEKFLPAEGFRMRITLVLLDRQQRGSRTQNLPTISVHSRDNHPLFALGEESEVLAVVIGKAD